MGRASVKENKTVYQLSREACSMTRAEASEKMQFITDSRIEKIENEKAAAAPDEVMAKAKAYGKPELCNYYCTHECAIGREWVPPIREKPIEAIVLEMLDTLNNLERDRNRLIEITSDGAIGDDQIEDFVRIRSQLERMWSVVASLRLWFDAAVTQGNVHEEILQNVLQRAKA